LVAILRNPEKGKSPKLGTKTPQTEEIYEDLRPFFDSFRDQGLCDDDFKCVCTKFNKKLIEISPQFLIIKKILLEFNEGDLKFLWKVCGSL